MTRQTIEMGDGGAVAVVKPWAGSPAIGTEITTAPVLSLAELLDIVGIPLILEKLSEKYDKPITKVRLMNTVSGDYAVTYDGHNVCIVTIQAGILI